MIIYNISTRHVRGSEKMDLGSDPTDPDLGSDGIIDPLLYLSRDPYGSQIRVSFFCLRSSEIIDPHLSFVNTYIPKKALVSTHKRSVLVMLCDRTS